MKKCELGDHMVEKLFHAKRKDRPSGCQNCVGRQKSIQERKMTAAVGDDVRELSVGDVVRFNDKGIISVRASNGGLLNPKLCDTMDKIDEAMGWDKVAKANYDYNLAVVRMKQAIAKVPSVKEQKSIPELIKLAVIVFHKWIRNRDSRNDAFRCISCNQLKSTKVMQAGHYMPSTYTSLKFNENNVNGECQWCNCYNQDHLTGYRLNLGRKIGFEIVEELESVPLALYHVWDRQELLDIIENYKIKKS